jgi:hypothetical protein
LLRLTCVNAGAARGHIVSSNERSGRMSAWRLTVGAALLLAASAVPPEAARAEAGERLVYEIVVTAPGTRSQGWHGTIYDKTGAPVTIAPGQTFETRIGTFESVACEHPWSTCGMIHADMLAWMKTRNANTIMGREPWVYRLFVLREGSKSEGWEGKLFFDGAEIAPCAAPRATPMGTFVCRGRAHLWDRAGWYHQSWPEGRFAFPG